MNKNYWEIEYGDLIPGVKFRFKKMSAVEHINLVTKNIDFSSMGMDKSDAFIQRCLELTSWSKDGEHWNDLINSDGRAKLPELENSMNAALDLFFYFKKDVLMPVFTESKTYQKFISEQEESQDQKTSEEQ